MKARENVDDGRKRDSQLTKDSHLVQKIIMICILISVRLWDLKMVGPKKQDFWPKINILKGNHCIVKIRGALVRQNWA